MAKTLVGLYNNLTSAEDVVRDLEEAGFGKDHLRTTSHDDDFKNSYGVDPARVDVAYLGRHGVPDDEAGFYADSVQQGGLLILAHVQDPDAEAAAEIMGRHAPVVYEPDTDELEAISAGTEAATESETQQYETQQYETHGVVQEIDATDDDEDVDNDETYPVAEAVTVVDTDDESEEHTTSLADDATSYDEEDTDVLLDEAQDEEATLLVSADRDERLSYTDFVEKLATVSAQLAQLQEEVHRLRTRSDDHAERIVRLEQRGDLVTERVQSAAETSVAKLEASLTERITRLEEAQRHFTGEVASKSKEQASSSSR